MRKHQRLQRGQGMTEYMTVSETRVFIGFAGWSCLKIQQVSKTACPKLDVYPAFFRGLATTLALLSRR